MQQYAHIHCVSKNLYNQDSGRTPIPFGVLDSHMVGARFIMRQSIDLIHKWQLINYSFVFMLVILTNLVSQGFH